MPGGQGIVMRSGTDHVKRIEAQVRHGDHHRPRPCRSVGALELDADALSRPDHEQIEFGAGVRRPEVCLVGFGQA